MGHFENHMTMTTWIPWGDGSIVHSDGTHGTIVELEPRMPGSFYVKFSDGVATSQLARALIFNGQPLDLILSAVMEDTSSTSEWEEMRRNQTVYFQRRQPYFEARLLQAKRANVLNLLRQERFDDADRAVAQDQAGAWLPAEYQNERQRFHAMSLDRQAANAQKDNERKREHAKLLLRAGHFVEADALRAQIPANIWPEHEYETERDVHQSLANAREAERVQKEHLRKRDEVKGLLREGRFSQAETIRAQIPLDVWPMEEYEAALQHHQMLAQAREAARTKSEQEGKRAQARSLLRGGYFAEAAALREQISVDIWSVQEYEIECQHEQNLAQEREITRKTIENEQKRERVRDLMREENFDEADAIRSQISFAFWPKDEYQAELARFQAVANQRRLLVERVAAALALNRLSDADSCFRDLSHSVGWSIDDYMHLKRHVAQPILLELNLELDDEQALAVLRPERRLLVQARAGAGKTRTLCARAALAMLDEDLDPNQVLILAFNKAAAHEVKQRIHKSLRTTDYANARTFHSLAYQLVKPLRTLLFNSGGQPSQREQSRFVQRMMQRILNPAFKEAMVEFFRKELEQIESYGRDLSPADYLVFRRSLEQVSLKGDRVRSNGEKFIADFLFEHGIEFRYEKAWMWKTPFLDGAVYKPDFSILAQGSDFILEHWALDPSRTETELPKHWGTTAQQYRQQIQDKRQFWRSKGIPLLETHVGLMADGREAFETTLHQLLEDAGIRCERLPQEEIVRRVFTNDFAITRIAECFLQFIQRAKKRGWRPDEVGRRISANPDKEPRARLFHALALRAYREYEAMLVEEESMDFDDLLGQATAEVETRGGSASIHLGQGEMMPLSNLKWILLDEYQDFSELYFRMLNAIISSNPDVRLMAVGDDWQAINAFAGAETRFFANFADYFGQGESVGVATNYRSNKLVVAAGNRLMEGRGKPARPSFDALAGEINVSYLSDVWIEFRKDASYDEARIADSLYLPPRDDGKNASESALRQAQALKACTRVLLSSKGRRTLLIARTGSVYGLLLSEFRARLLAIVAQLSSVDEEALEEQLSVMTAHGSKGQEAHTVVILDATARQFPKVHPDNLLFELFGVTPQGVLDEERRLFYVALTRAEQRLFVLTEKGQESPYVECLVREWDAVPKSAEVADPIREPGPIALQILERMATLRAQND